MASIIRVGDYCSCSVDNVVMTGSNNVYCNGVPVAIVGSVTSAHPGGNQANLITSGNTSGVYAGGVAICVSGALDSPHGSGIHQNAVAVGGSPDVTIG